MFVFVDECDEVLLAVAVATSGCWYALEICGISRLGTVSATLFDSGPGSTMVQFICIGVGSVAQGPCCNELRGLSSKLRVGRDSYLLLLGVSSGDIFTASNGGEDSLRDTYWAYFRYNCLRCGRVQALPR